MNNSSSKNKAITNTILNAILKNFLITLNCKMMNKDKNTIILGIESSCDDTSAAILCNDKLLANVIAGQEVHRQYGGVVPELASRAHQQNIVPVVDTAIKRAGITKEDLNAIAFTRGPGLMGSLLVGSSFAKAFSLARNIPLIEVNHMIGHVLAHFIKINDDDQVPEFPFLCLTVSGGHTQLVLVNDVLDMEVIGQTIDDAAGEAIDKAAKIMGLGYPGGPVVDKLAKTGESDKFTFSTPKVSDLDFSFSGLKTSFLYLVQKEMNKDAEFIEKEKNNLCASYQKTVVDYLLLNMNKTLKQYPVKAIALAGGVSANSELRARFEQLGKEKGIKTFIPPFQFCTDNAAMIAITGYFKYLNQEFSNQEVSASARYSI
jgi:N6-L-threonylcarbamoyladenine synthase